MSVTRSASGHSRFVVGHGVDDAERANMVISTFEDAVTRHGKPELLMHDRVGVLVVARDLALYGAARRARD